MYPERLDGRPADPFAASCYFDVDYLPVRSELPPYAVIQEGIGGASPGSPYRCRKRRSSGWPPTSAISNAAGTTHLPIADVSGAVLHYKFAGDLRRRVGEAIARKEHFAGAISYRRLEGALGTAGFSQSLLSVHSHQYYGPDSLVHHGLIKSTPEWDGHRPRRPVDAGIGATQY